MSVHDKSEDRRSPPKSPTPSDRGPPKIIEFIDSQAPNTKSAIQRHTAQHAAAQRREAKLQALRESVRPRNLQWQRKSSAEGPSSLGSGPSSQPPSPAPGLSNEQAAFGSGPKYDFSELSTIAAPESISQPRSSSEQMRTYSQFEESVLQQSSISCPHQRDNTYPDRFVSMVRKDEASTYLLISFLLSIRSLTQLEDGLAQAKALAMEYRGRGQNILMQRLQDHRQACSDANIQAVLIFVALVSDFGDKEETQIHINGLQNMINQRGGLKNLEHDPFLHRQLKEVKISRALHLPVECGPGCTDALRFSATEQEFLSL